MVQRKEDGPGFELNHAGRVYAKGKDIPRIVAAINDIRDDLGIFGAGGIYTGVPVEDPEHRARQQALSPKEHTEFWELYEESRSFCLIL